MSDDPKDQRIAELEAKLDRALDRLRVLEMADKNQQPTPDPHAPLRRAIRGV
jgi:hypothetical protein